METTTDLYRRPAPGVQTRWASFENPGAVKGGAATANRGAKGAPFAGIAAGETKTLVDVTGPGVIHRIWLTVSDRSPERLRALRIDMWWDGAATPAVSAPLGDFFGIGLGRRGIPFECALFSDPEGRSFDCFAPMPFRTAARVTVTNEGATDLTHLYYDADMTLGADPGDDALYFHAHWRRERPNRLGEPFTILPRVQGTGRYLGCNIGVLADPVYQGAWWGEGELKVWLDGDGEHPTLCGTGTEDMLGTAWGQGTFAHRTQGCTVADAESGAWAFYRYHTLDPVWFHSDCRVALDVIGGGERAKVLALHRAGVPLVPLSVDLGTGRTVNLREGEPMPPGEGGGCNFFRRDDYSATAYFYLDRPENGLPPLAGVEER